MFNGIIEHMGTVEQIESQSGGKLLRVSCTFSGDLKMDESISINGVCQTVVQCGSGHFDVQIIEETLNKTALGELAKKDRVNLERSLRLSDRISGHLVQGHVDTTGSITSIENAESGRLIGIHYPEEFHNLIVGRGSICVDGISLTVAREKGSEFTVAIIPYTFEHTNLKFKRPNDPVNLEFDIFGKYAVRYLQNTRQRPKSS
ncbi:MAG: riboflavin synthase [Balneolales bacterium]